jgi:hydroxymethylpyrimidine pyrophosphatase-like HAD family hydrolase
MIIASDLDRTLMYSKRALNELGHSSETKLKPVEMKDGNWVGYMTETAFSDLKKLSRESLFIPVTTRTTEQYKRFVIFENEVPLTYAITSNGANILYKGKPLKEWSEKLFFKMAHETLGLDEFLSTLLNEGYYFDGQLKKVDKLFFYFILNCLPSSYELSDIRELASSKGWRLSLQGRKLYFIPKLISKGNALRFICEREGMEALAGAGDSVLDWDFLKNCRYPFVPKHGELKEHVDASLFTLTNKLGIAAGEEILKKMRASLLMKT